MRVLVVDDNRGAAEVLAMFFELDGKITRVAVDGEEAIAEVESFDPHLVLMDLGMPRMDGYEAARRIRAHNPRVVLVALTGSDGEEAVKRTVASGFDLHLVKPATPESLRGVVDRYFPKRS
jgi:two-component system CheB/CheR fusion protein